MKRPALYPILVFSLALGAIQGVTITVPARRPSRDAYAFKIVAAAL